MRTQLIALIVVLGLIGGGTALCQAQGSPTQGFNVHRVAGNVYMIENGYGGGNVAVLAGRDGLVLVDADEEPRHQLLLAALKQLSDKPVRYVIDTHCHGDHTWGNAAFQREGATVIAHRNVRKRLATNSHCGPRPGTGLPTVTFDDELTLYIDDEEVRIVKLPAGHTDGDSMIYFEKANVVETGDAFVTNELPGWSKQQGGTVVGIIDELKKILEMVPEGAKVIPGHGQQASIGDVHHALQTLEGMRDAVQRRVRAGSTLDEIREMNVLSPWKAAFGPPCIAHTPCDHLDSNLYLNGFYRALTTVQAPSNASPNQSSDP